jgi:hypothetical protein
MFSRSLYVMLLVVDVPPHDPHPNVSDGTRPVVSPIRPCVAGEFTRMRLAGIDVAKRLTRRSSEV